MQGIETIVVVTGEQAVGSIIWLHGHDRLEIVAIRAEPVQPDDAPDRLLARHYLDGLDALHRHAPLSEKAAQCSAKK